MSQTGDRGGRTAPQRDGQGAALSAGRAGGLLRFLDLTQDFSLHTPAFAAYPGPAIRWIKHLAFDRAGGQEITITLHVSTRLDPPAPFLTRGRWPGHPTLPFLPAPPPPPAPPTP